MQQETGLLPLALDGAFGHAPHRGDLGEREAAEELQVDHLRELRLDGRQFVEHLNEGIGFADRHQIYVYRNYCVSWLASCDRYLGNRDDAAEHALDILQQPNTCSTSRLMSLVALGRLRTRRGDAGAADTLEQALAQALANDSPQHIAPVRAARAEAAFLRGDLRMVVSEGDDDARLEALALFEQLAARPATDGLRRQLRAEGRRGPPRGMRPSTQTSPHQLTAREAEALLFLCEALKNSEIAERLFRSVRPVDHPLAAVFAKLGVTSRVEAVAAAFRAGIHAKNGQARTASQASSP